nr:helix-turn-helix transcriptional regulator [Muricauda sp. DH64]
MNKEIVARIETIIDYLELSVSAFADEIGVQRSSISHLLNGRNKPSLDFIMKLVHAYPEVDLYWLLKGEGSFPKQQVADIEEEVLEQKKEPASPSDLNVAKTKSTGTKEPSKIVIFYPDGTFETYHSKKD